MDPRYLASFLPRLVRRHLARSDAGPLLPIEVTHAAMLLTDMQGFTRKVEEAAAGGRDALDRFTFTLDQYFCDLIDLVHASGGDVLAFAGDSMLCIWPCVSDTGLRDATRAAASAGMQIQKKLDGREETRVGIGAGAIACTLAGGFGGRWELFASGEALSGAAEAERLGLPGQVVLSPTAWRLIEQDGAAALLASGCYVLGQLRGIARLPDADAADAAEALPAAPVLHPMLPAVVMHHVAVGQEAWLSELRPVSVVVVGMPGLDIARPEGLADAQRGIRTLQEVFHEFGGSPRCVIDGKGHLIAGDFGLPPASTERHAERAVRAARGVQRKLAQLGIDCAIGVASGRAVCMGFGNSHRRDFGVIGDGTVIATRLMQAARNEVLCDESTARASGDRISFVALSPLHVKGREQEVAVFRLGDAERSRLRDIPVMVGREPERALIAARIEQLTQQTGGVVLIEGEAGAGKSLLLAEAGRLAHACGLRALQGDADVVDRDTPYLAWRPIFSRLLDITPEMDGEAATRHILRTYSRAQNLVDYLPLLGPVLGLTIADTRQTAGMAGEVRAGNTHRTMQSVLRYFAEAAPLVLMIEDAHWLDSGSARFLRWMARRPGAILILVSSRPERPFIEQLRAGLAGPGLHTIQLGEMEEAALLALARQTLGVQGLPLALEKLLRHGVGGNPYFCSELIRALIESGRIRVIDGRCEVLDLTAGDLPASVESVILGRLARLAPAEQFCLKAASVLGPSFREEALRAIHPVDLERDQVAARLAPAERGGLISVDVAPPDGSWSFCHAIVRDTTYALWTLAQRQPLHRAVALWYETRFAGDLPPMYPLLAHHWDQSGDAEAAALYLERAGEQALRAGAYQEGRRLFGRVLQLLQEGRLQAPAARRARWHSGIGMAHYYLGEFDRSQQQLEAAVALIDRPLPVAVGRVRQRLIASLFEQALHRLRPATYVGRRANQQADIETAVESYSKLSQIYYLNGEAAERLLAVTIGGLNLAEQGRPSASLARVLAGSAIVAALAGLDRLADDYALRAQDIATQPAHREAATQVWHFRAILCAQRGHWVAARAANDRALTLMRELGDQTLEVEACVVRSTFMLCQSRYLDAEAAWTRGLLLARRAGNAQIECWCLLDEAETHLGRGDLDSAAQALELALQIPTPATDGSSALEKNRMLALVRLGQNQPEQAFAACLQVHARVNSQAPAGYHWADYHASAVEVVLRLLQRDDSFARDHRPELMLHARRGVRRLRALGKRFGNVRVRAVLLAGVLDLIEAQPARALRRWREAAALGITLDNPGERIRALIELSRHGQAPAPQELEEALAWLGQNGAFALMQQLQSALAPRPAAQELPDAR